MEELETRKKVLPEENTDHGPAERESGFATRMNGLELEAKSQMTEKLLEGPSRENEDDPTQAERQQQMSKRARNKFRFRIVPSLQYWDRKWKKNSSPSTVSEKQVTEGQEEEKAEPAIAKRARNKFRFHVPSLRYLSGAMYSKGKREGTPNFVPMMG